SGMHVCAREIMIASGHRYWKQLPKMAQLLDMNRELIRGDGLYEVVVRACLEGGDLIMHGGAPGQRHQEHMARGGTRVEGGEQLHAGGIWQTELGHQECRHAALDGGKRRGTRADHTDDMLAPQPFSQHLSALDIRINDQHAELLVDGQATGECLPEAEIALCSHRDDSSLVEHA